MARLMGLDDNEAQKTVSGYGYSSVSIDALTDSEYTVAKIAIDKSSSVMEFRDQLEDMIQNCVEGCKKSAREENILLGMEAFSDGLEEIHGFVPLPQIDAGGYKGTINPSGMTALYDATLSAIESVKQYSESLIKMDYICNAIVFVITDGGENASRKATVKKIKQAIADVRKEEQLESIRVILIGVGEEEYVKDSLDEFQKDVSIDQFVWAGQATPKVLAKIGQFVSESVSSQSQALGTGKPSQQLNITF